MGIITTLASLSPGFFKAALLLNVYNIAMLRCWWAFWLKFIELSDEKMPVDGPVLPEGGFLIFKHFTPATSTRWWEKPLKLRKQHLMLKHSALSGGATIIYQKCIATADCIVPNSHGFRKLHDSTYVIVANSAILKGPKCFQSFLIIGVDWLTTTIT